MSKINKNAKVPLFRPLRHKLFRNLCLANFIANIGSWMQIFATGWLVASQTSDPSIAAMAQTLTQIPTFLFSVLGGVMADRFNTYRYLFGVNVNMAIAATALAIYSLLSTPSISVIFILTFLIASGTALKASTWQASMSSLVEHHEIESAATLNGLSYNLASIIGPALGSCLFLVTGPALLYFTNALCLTGLIVIYWNARNLSDKTEGGTKKRLIPLLKEGAKVSFSHKEFRSILVTTVIIFFAVSTFQALLPIYVNNILKGNSDTLGGLMAIFGLGAVISAFALPTIRVILARYKLLALASSTYALSLIVYSLHPLFYILLPASFIAGFSWAIIVSTMNSAAQSVFDKKIRARALSIYSMCFYGALTAGSLTWGKIAEHYDITIAFMSAGSCMIIIALYIFLLKKVAKDEHVSAPPLQLKND